MNRPLVISDCDEVLLHMVVPFRDWLGEAHDIDFTIGSNDFARALRRRSDNELVEGAEIWRLLNLFFDTEMYRQTPFAGAIEAMHSLGETADVVVLTNLMDHRLEMRAAQLKDHGLAVRVFTNQGPKGPALQAILAEYAPSRAVFIDDIANHHGSVAEVAPQVARLHLCGEPLLAPHIACAHKLGHADARIDNWADALPWVQARLRGEVE
jgi:FMN phosphatase YigB (HAD superfamily)